MNNSLPEWLQTHFLRPTLTTPTDRRDDDLIEMLDQKGLWLIRGGQMGVLGSPFETLRTALMAAHDLSMRGSLPGPIVRMPDDNVRIPAEQIYRLWQRIDLN